MIITDTQRAAGADMATPALFAAKEGPFALFLDFDGTLVEIASRPDAVEVAEHLPDLLARLRDRLGGALAIVSGRPIAVLDAYLAPHRFDAAGLHGAEQRIRDVVQVDEASDPARLRPLAADLKEFAGGRPGLIVEDKGRSLALHWREAQRFGDEAVERMREAARLLGRDYRLQEGKDVIELLPRWATKGAAIDRFMDVEPYTRRRPVFVGDDATDEHGFDVVGRQGGIGIRIGQGSTLATHRLSGPRDLHRLLASWDDFAPEAGPAELLTSAAQDRS